MLAGLVISLVVGTILFYMIHTSSEVRLKYGLVWVSLTTFIVSSLIGTLTSVMIAGVRGA